MPLRLPEPGTFAHLLRPATVSSLVRLSRCPSTEPYWSRAARYRFDDALPVRPGQFGVCYGATTLETAFAESVLHENALFYGGRFLVAEADLRARWRVSFVHPKKKRLKVDPAALGACHPRCRRDVGRYPLRERTGLTKVAEFKLAGADLDALCEQFGVTAVR